METKKYTFKNDEKKPCYLSTYFPARIVYNGEEYKTCEHAFQAQKYLGSKSSIYDKKYAKKIQKTKRARKAHKLGCSTKGKQKIRSDWEDYSIVTLREILMCKFTQHIELQKQLLSTGNQLIEDTEIDGGYFYYNTNIVGILLMYVRETINENNLMKKNEKAKSEEQKCPICKKIVEPTPRYPNSVCKD
ncbi:hypothetical protein M0812_19711 [Anaeramoeba flamelloides]|nr:hypothetical protein M0812_19711 [Anaeramoeba flamelloides]